MLFSGSCQAVANTPVRGTLRAHAVIWRSYRPAAAPAWSPFGGFQDTKERSPAASSSAAADCAKDDGSVGSKLRRIVIGPSCPRSRVNRSTSVSPPLTAAPTARQLTAYSSVGLG